MEVSKKTNLYDPLNVLSFTLFDDDKANQDESASKVKEHLEGLSSEDLQQQSSEFFQWIVKHNIDSHVVYAQHLLDYFHSKNLLLTKKEVQTFKKQDKSRYVVIYDMNGKVFSKIYNSIREIREDTGKKPSKICKYKI